MTLEEALLEKLARWRPGARAALDVDAPEGGWKLALVADQVDSLALKAWELTLTRPAPASAGKPLAERAGALAARVTGLLEPLRLVEVDSGRAVAQLRSAAPLVRGADAFYYEVLLEGETAVRLRRFQANRASTRRQQVGFALTHEALARVAADLAAT